MADFIRLRTGEDIENRYSVYGLNCNKSALSWNWSVRKRGKQNIGKNVRTINNPEVLIRDKVINLKKVV
ncbi:MAG: hypothetical protein MTP17_01650 [Candidatus Midichloria sp.]|nr:MAG: hypothetical protein MTP17_01650 [Candidatus Midichloria sp.]